MGRISNALLEVSLFFILFIAITILYVQFIKPLFTWPLYSMIHYLAWTAIILILLAMTKRDFSIYGVSLRNVNLDLKVAAIWIVPLCFFNILTDINISSVFNFGGLASVLALTAVVVLILYVMDKLSTGHKEDGVFRAVLILMPAAAIGTLIIVPALLLPGILKFTTQSVDYFVLAFAFVGPVEELIFRGYIQSRLNEAFGRPHRFFGVSWGMGLIIASLLFGIMHMFNGFNPFIGHYGLNLPYGLIAFFMGLVMGIVRERTGSIVAPAILHGALDFVDVIF